ncbi:hypothetical protein ACW5XW_24255 [Aeromonas piscicola]|uniref:hypothetical protein n=1 Tax=Aeromonas piscicola TaxID=600645 RepID=UPI000AA9FBDE|nr:hypothetical protein [Aeromonas piscicola]
MNYQITIVDDDPLEKLSDEVEEIILSKSIVAAIIAEHKKQMTEQLRKIGHW